MRECLGRNRPCLFKPILEIEEVGVDPPSNDRLLSCVTSERGNNRPFVSALGPVASERRSAEYLDDDGWESVAGPYYFRETSILGASLSPISRSNSSGD